MTQHRGWLALPCAGAVATWVGTGVGATVHLQASQVPLESLLSTSATTEFELPLGAATQCVDAGSCRRCVCLLSTLHSVVKSTARSRLPLLGSTVAVPRFVKQSGMHARSASTRSLCIACRRALASGRTSWKGKATLAKVPNERRNSVKGEPERMLRSNSALNLYLRKRRCSCVRRYN